MYKTNYSMLCVFCVRINLYKDNSLILCCVFCVRINLYKDNSLREAPALSGGMRKATLEWKYVLRGVSDDPEPLINYLDVSTVTGFVKNSNLCRVKANNFSWFNMLDFTVVFTYK